MDRRTVCPAILALILFGFVARSALGSGAGDLLANSAGACYLPPDPGPCDGVCPRFFHNKCTGQCEPFTYGCCEGNANNFFTVEACQAACPPAGDVCLLPPDPGPCDGDCPRFFHNACTAQCEPFSYGCCEGNANNFLTLEECEAACPAALVAPIPTVSEWGLMAMAAAVLAAGTFVVAGRRRRMGSV